MFLTLPFQKNKIKLMNLQPFKFILFIALVSAFSACSWLDTTTTDPSSNAGFVSLKFASNDSIPGLGTAAFTLEWDDLLHDSVIVNLDSLPFKTKINKVIPTFSFHSSAGAYVYLTDTLGLNTISDSILLKGTDTLNFNRVVKIKNIAANEVNFRVYPIKVNVHKVEPKLYQWNKIADDIYSNSGNVQKAVYFKNTFFLYVCSETNNYLYTSTDGKAWTNKTTSLKNPSLNCNIRGITEFNSKLYMLGPDAKIYSTADGYEWTAQNGDISESNYKFQQLLFVLNGKLWSVLKSNTGDTYRFANSSDAKTWLVYNQIPSDFPISDFSALTFASRTNKPKALVAGGYNASGQLLKNVWSTENGSYWVDFSTENSTLGPIAGASIIAYDSKLLLFGGVRQNQSIIDSTSYLISIDEGLSWSRPDSLYNCLRQMNISSTGDTTYVNYTPRAYVSAVNVVKDHSSLGYSDYLIYLIGGVNPDKTVVYKDVWLGKLNSLSFKR